MVSFLDSTLFFLAPVEYTAFAFGRAKSRSRYRVQWDIASAGALFNSSQAITDKLLTYFYIFELN
jgi:hypothetical protein